ncbi:ParB/Srx family N-terminal domain-containing protein [Paraburkholderia adhaesiva]|uniref:ParB/Srx family N-terminal domain-containing protein n=1 Tax=Paraburkholderia adhaesiva TaxID=2883244 RepID=UPI001F391E2E|nr:ParB/Srx family N-terminal domain-containing protein [Paraburkholderia adhaesiva]
MKTGQPSPPWPADRVERWPLARVRPFAHNPRTHTDAQVDEIAAAMREWGWTNPLLVDESGELIAGHGRLLAAQRLGLTDAPVMVARGWSAAQKRAYRIADNKLPLNAGWDTALLHDALATLAGEGIDVALLGFSADDMARLSDDTDRLLLDAQAQTALDADPFSGPVVHVRTVEDAAGVTWVPFSCMVALTDRPALLDAIRAAKARGAADSGAALVMIAREWSQQWNPT